MQIRQMLLLHLQGHSNRWIADQLSISRNTINKYVHKAKELGLDRDNVLAMDEVVLADHFKSPEAPKDQRLDELHQYFPEVLKQSKQVGFTYQAMWEGYRQIYEDGYGYTQFLEHYHRWNRRNEPTLKLHHPAAEKVMVDYAGEKLSWVNRDTGEVQDVDVFVACLPASGYVYVQASASQQKEDFIGSMISCLNYFGGVPEVIVCDNLKSAVHKASKYEAIANRTFRDMAMYYGAVLNPTRPYRPKDKALVERLVDLVYEQIYFKMRGEVYHSLHALNERIRELRELTDRLNNRKLSQLDCTRRELFLSTEYSKLKPLPPQPYAIKTYQRAKVQKNTHVLLSADKHYYSVPYRYIGRQVVLHYTDRVVEIYHNHERIASHRRIRVKAGYTSKANHLASHHQKYLGWKPEIFIDKAAEIGPHTRNYVERLFSQSGYIEAKYKSAMGIVQLQRHYPPERIEAAARLAKLHPHSSYQRLRELLAKGLDQHPDLFDHLMDRPDIPAHDNIRGPHYYN